MPPKRSRYDVSYHPPGHVSKKAAQAPPPNTATAPAKQANQLESCSQTSATKTRRVNKNDFCKPGTPQVSNLQKTFDSDNKINPKRNSKIPQFVKSLESKRVETEARMDKIQAEVVEVSRKLERLEDFVDWIHDDNYRLSYKLRRVESKISRMKTLGGFTTGRNLTEDAMAIKAFREQMAALKQESAQLRRCASNLQPPPRPEQVQQGNIGQTEGFTNERTVSLAGADNEGARNPVAFQRDLNVNCPYEDSYAPNTNEGGYMLHKLFTLTNNLKKTYCQQNDQMSNPLFNAVGEQPRTSNGQVYGSSMSQMQKIPYYIPTIHYKKEKLFINEEDGVQTPVTECDPVSTYRIIWHSTLLLILHSLG